MLLYYQIALVSSLLLTCHFIAKWGKNISVYISQIFLLIPFINLCYLKFAEASSIREALLANGFLYLLNFFIQFVFFLYIFSFCKIRFNRVLVFSFFFILIVALYVIAFSPLTIGLLYESVELKIFHEISYLEKVYGPAHKAYYLMLFIFFMLGLTILLFNVRNKTNSRKNTTILLLLYMIVILSFVIGRFLNKAIDVLPITYNLLQICLLLLVRRLYLYDLDLIVSSSISHGNVIGIAWFDFSHHFLGCNQQAINFIPELSTLYVDEKVKNSCELFEKINVLLSEFETTAKPTKLLLKGEKQTLKITADFLISNKAPRGFQLRIEDNTKEQEYIHLINNYNLDLEKEVNLKTARIQDLLSDFVMGMAEMVQNRDNSTGGHIKRTSEVVKILTCEMRKDSKLGLSPKFYDDLIKAAPMHDLGKIAVDDAILRKPGKFTEEEFSVMKTHAEKGAEIIRNILGATDDKDFLKLTENVAFYHHERFDGSGYPKGISGEQIPLEARIMAIADVYDALVSRRCYKEAFSFDKAWFIIEEGMGSQFDPKLNPYFTACRQQIEDYYRSLPE